MQNIKLRIMISTLKYHLLSKRKIIRLFKHLLRIIRIISPRVILHQLNSRSLRRPILQFQNVHLLLMIRLKQNRSKIVTVEARHLLSLSYSSKVILQNQNLIKSKTPKKSMKPNKPIVNFKKLQ